MVEKKENSNGIPYGKNSILVVLPFKAPPLFFKRIWNGICDVWNSIYGIWNIPYAKKGKNEKMQKGRVLG
jgi:hypothetical protein